MRGYDVMCFSVSTVISCSVDFGAYVILLLFLNINTKLVFPVALYRLTDLTGSLTDGPVNYKYKTKCTWLIEG